MSVTKTKYRSLTVRLLRQEITSGESALKSPSDLTKVPLKKTLPFTGALFVSQPSESIPTWTEFLNLGTAKNLKVKTNRQTSAILFITVTHKKRAHIFALTFGQGHHHLQTDAWVSDFGLKVALNTVDRERLRSIDAQTIDDQTMHTRRQVSRKSPVDIFGLDTSRDLLRAVTGEPEDKSFADRVTGAEALSIYSRIEFEELGDKCKQLLRAYERTEYQKNFAWVDQIRQVRDSLLNKQLDDALMAALRTKRVANLHMVPPEVINWEGSGFRFSNMPAGKEADIDLEIERYLEVVKKPQGLQLDHIKKRDKVQLHSGEDDSIVAHWPVYKCIVFQVDYDKKTYVLNSGTWFGVSKSFSREVDNYVSTIARCSLVFPDARSREREDRYSKRVAKSFSKEIAVLDKKTIQIDKQKGSIEVCDLFTKNRQFVHVKPWSQSSTLSHLLAQSRVSAESFLNSLDFRKNMLKHVPKSWTAIHKDFARSIPDFAKVEIVLAVISKPTKMWPTAFPFFSRLNLVQTCKWFATIRLRVTTLHIRRL